MFLVWTAPLRPVTSHKYFCEKKILKQNQRCPCGTEPVTVVALQIVPLPQLTVTDLWGPIHLAFTLFLYVLYLIFP